MSTGQVGKPVPAQVGRYLPCSQYLPSDIAEMSERGFGFVVLPLIHPHRPSDADTPTVDGAEAVAEAAADAVADAASADGSSGQSCRFSSDSGRCDLVSHGVDEDRPRRVSSKDEGIEMESFIASTGVFTNSFQHITGGDWSILVVGEVPSWADLDAECPKMRLDSRTVLRQHLELAAHLSLAAVMIALPRYNCANLAMELTSYTLDGPKQQLWLRVPMVEGQEAFESQVTKTNTHTFDITCKNGCNIDHLHHNRTLDHNNNNDGGGTGGDDDPFTRICAACVENSGAAPPSNRLLPSGRLYEEKKRNGDGDDDDDDEGGDKVIDVTNDDVIVDGFSNVNDVPLYDDDCHGASSRGGGGGLSYDGAGGCNRVSSLPSITVTPNVPENDESWFTETSLNATSDERVLQSESSSYRDPWEWFNCLRTLTDNAPLINVALVVPRHLPPISVVRRWLGEKIRCTILPTTIFRRNHQGYPVLPVSHQVFLHKLMILGTQFVIAGKTKSREEDLLFRRYIEYLYQSQPPASNASMNLCVPGYKDFLSVAAQPLIDDIDCRVFEIYDKDRTKYILYYEAMKMTIEDKMASATKELNMMIVPAGRGTLVKLALRAAETVKAKLKVYAVEPNINTITFLQLLFGLDPNVVIISASNDATSMSQLIDTKIDILVSDLLGSLGCDSLCPEIMDDAIERFVASDAIVIPSEYSSHVVPVMAPLLLNRVRQQVDLYNSYPEYPFETCYVTQLTNCCLLATPKPLFNFFHFTPPTTSPENEKGSLHRLTDSDLNLYRTLEWVVDKGATCHGFAGYFTAHLYKNKILSTLPESHSKNLISWFPTFFPLKNPQFFKQGDKVTASFWRRSTPKKSWYEWTITSPRPISIHNAHGRAHSFLLKYPIPREMSSSSFPLRLSFAASSAVAAQKDSYPTLPLSPPSLMEVWNVGSSIAMPKAVAEWDLKCNYDA